jgi:2-polyprenyl-6-methoxyphenol hydroxylase-like FAD-dependent oxidoreductase
MLSDVTNTAAVPGTLDTPVLIVGAGPVGAILALELAHHNMPSMVVERSVRPSRHPKMDYVNGRSMELLRRLDLTAAIRAQGVDSRHSTDFIWTLGFDQPPVLVWHHPSVDQMRRRFAGVNDGTAPAEPYQRIQGSLLEALLRDAARAHPLVDLREGWTLSDLHQDPAGVRATVLNARTRTRSTVNARYLVGCDGANSTVRRCLGIPIDQAGVSTRHCSVYFSSRDPVLRRHGRAFLTIGAKGLNLVSRDEKDLWTASMPIPADDLFAADPIALIRDRLGVDFEVDEVLSVAQWEGALTLAAQYRKGSAFLAGDAAHQFYPAGGHGANTGIADAVDLGWKLAATLAGWGGPDLLASYEKERRPLALFNRELCAGLLAASQTFGRLAAAGVGADQLAGVLEQEVYQVDDLGVHFGYRYSASPVIWHEPGTAPPWQWRSITPTTWPGGRAPAILLADGTQLFDRLGTGFTLVDLSRHGSGGPLVKEAERRNIPMKLLALDDPAVRACWERDLVLVRPDQHVAWRDNDPPADWDAILDRITGVGGPAKHVNA